MFDNQKLLFATVHSLRMGVLYWETTSLRSRKKVVRQGDKKIPTSSVDAMG